VKTFRCKYTYTTRRGFRGSGECVVEGEDKIAKLEPSELEDMSAKVAAELYASTGVEVSVSFTSIVVEEGGPK
jgi:hypothetical protein